MDAEHEVAPALQAPVLAPIESTDLHEVGAFLHRHLNRRLTAEQWAAAFVPPWPVDSPNHGFLLRRDGALIGVYLAIYATRTIGGRTERFCNLAAWCVLESDRQHGLRLVRALLAQRGYTFTDLSPSGNVVELDRRLRFTELDTTTALSVALPLPHRGSRVVDDPDRIRELLKGDQLQLFDDHRRAAAVIHLVVRTRAGDCYLMVRRVTRRRLPVFAAVLYVSDRSLLPQAFRALTGHLLLRHRIPFVLVERRTTGYRPRASTVLAHGRPKFFRSRSLGPDQIDDLYSELTCVSW